MKDTFPFSAVVGQPEAQLALVLAAVDPAIGGVLLRGEKGSAKSTLARGLAGLLPGGAPFVELPVGATEDRVLGSLDLRAALGDGDDRFRPGLLAAANGGVLYVDEVNLLPDHLVDALLDAAASGVNRVERDGVSHEHPARFVLLGSMNPEEGELRPQLLDRFGLSVEVTTPRDPLLRAEAVRRRLAHDAGVAAGTGDDESLRWKLASSRPAALSDDVLAFAARLAVEVGAESLRADLVLCRAAAALAGWEGRTQTTADDIIRVAALALAHRRRRRPFDPPTMPPEDLAAAVSSAAPAPDEKAGGADQSDGSPGSSQRDQPDRHDGSDLHDPSDERLGSDGSDVHDRSDRHEGSDGSDGSDQRNGPSGADQRDRSGRSDGSGGVDQRDGASGSDVAGGTSSSSPGSWAGELTSWEDLAGGALDQPGSPLDAAPDRRDVVEGRGRTVGSRHPLGPHPQGVAVLATARAALQRRLDDPSGPALTAADIREPRRGERQPRTVILCVDASGSMGTRERVTAATGAVLGLLADAYLQRDQVALVAFRDGAAVEVLPPTGSVELARARLADLPTGGPTPLAEGITTALTCAQRAAAKGSKPLLVLLTDGRATGSPSALDQAYEAARAVADAAVDALILDAEPPGPAALRLTAELAAAMNARHLPLPTPSVTTIESTIRQAITAR